MYYQLKPKSPSHLSILISTPFFIFHFLEHYSTFSFYPHQIIIDQVQRRADTHESTTDRGSTEKLYQLNTNYQTGKTHQVNGKILQACS